MTERKNRKKRPDVVYLRQYREKRDFSRTREPPGGEQEPSREPLFVVQKHAARRLHYDLRLEAGGVLLSWAVPKGPSYDTGEKRLAVHVEDHPLEYADFEGLIAEHEYGAGTVMVWDRGTWTPLGDWKKGLHEGKLSFLLSGKKLKGHWKLIRLKSGEGRQEFDEPPKENWLLMKADDDEARQRRGLDVTLDQPLSVKTGRTMEEIASQKTAYWESTREGTRPAAAKSMKPAAPAPPMPRGRKAPWPSSLLPQLATLVTRLPEAGHWLSEIKFDGYRLLAWIRDGRVTLTTRRGQDWTDKFQPIARELSRLPISNAILDGEVVVMNPDGTTNFQKLQNILRLEDEGSLLFHVFDLPYYEGHDLSDVPLIERKNMLRDLVSTYRERLTSVRYTEHLEESGERVLRAACVYAVEGIIAKRADSPYLQKRTKYWLKKKCINRQEFVVGGFTAPKGTRSLFGSLVLGYYDASHRLIYCGNVGTGFNERSIKEVYEQLKELEQPESPFSGPIEDARNRPVRWVAPQLVAEVEFSDWTEAGHLRHPSFVGIREDKRAEEIRREEPSGAADNEVTPPAPLRSDVGRNKESLIAGVGSETLPIPIPLTNPDRVFYPASGLTKKQLAEYYLRVGDRMLPEVVNRPLVLVRCPEGIVRDMRENCFFQKHLREDIPEWVRTAPIEEKGTVGLYPVVDDLNGVLSLVQLGVLEIHMLGCRADSLDHPDRMIFDLDPAPDVPTDRLIEASFYIYEWLRSNKMRPLFKLTGGKGLHIVVPINQVLTWEELKKLSKAIATEMVRIRPQWFVATVTKSKRTGRILIDYLRNSQGASSIVPFSTRARADAAIAVPIAPEDLTEELLRDPITVANSAVRLRQLRQDAWEGVR